jgi:hypothetical protein
MPQRYPWINDNDSAGNEIPVFYRIERFISLLTKSRHLREWQSRDRNWGHFRASGDILPASHVLFTASGKGGAFLSFPGKIIGSHDIMTQINIRIHTCIQQADNFLRAKNYDWWLVNHCKRLLTRPYLNRLINRNNRTPLTASVFSTDLKWRQVIKGVFEWSQEQLKSEIVC